MNAGVAVRRASDWTWEELARGRFAARVADVGRSLGTRKLGYNVQEIPPGKASVPYHAHYVNEELIVVLEGQPSVRLDGREHRLRRGHVVALPPGAESAHQLLNRSGAPARALLASTRIPRELVEYGDSGKRGIRVSEIARDPERESLLLLEDHVIPRSAYFEGEPVDEPLGDAPAGTPEPDPRIVHPDDLPWEEARWGDFGGERARLARAAGARLLGYSLVRVPAGKRFCPYHFHHVNEEAFFVESGRGFVRTPDGEIEVGPGDVVACATGPGGAHQFRAGVGGPLVFLALATMEEPEISEYPDSGKVYVMSGSAPGGDPSARSLDLLFRKSDDVDYLDGEA